MYKFTKIIIPLTVLCLFITVLNGCKNSVENSELPKYVPNVQWSLETKLKDTESKENQYANYLYFIENVFYDNALYSSCNICKVDLQNGKVVWRTLSYIGIGNTAPIKCGNYIFVERYYNNESHGMYCFSDATGELLATIGISENELQTKRIKIDSLYPVDDKYLIWSNGANNITNGILKIKLSDIDFSKNAEIEQYLNIEYLLSFTIENMGVYTHFINDGSIVYFQTYSRYDYLPDSLIGAIDVETGNLLWQYESKTLLGIGYEGLFLLDDSSKNLNNRLYIFENSLACINSKNGSLIWDKFQTEQNLLKEKYLGGLVYNRGVTYHDGSFFYTTTETPESSCIQGRKQSLFSNIKCLDAKTGKLKWDYLPVNSNSQFTRPIVANGKVFVLTAGAGLYVFDEETGALIGVDESVYTGGAEKNALYNGNVIFFDFSSGYGVLKAIKP